jgi:hypothetical protein
MSREPRAESREPDECSFLALDPRLLTLDHFYPRGAVRSARHPVKVEIVGSNPIGDAFANGAVRKLEKRRSSNLREFVGSTPTRATKQSMRVE